MIIVWVSLAVIVAAIVYLGIFAFRTFKESKPTIEKIKATTTRIQQQTDSITQETNSLSAKQEQLMEDINYKKEAINVPINAAKGAVPRLKSLWKSTPYSNLTQKK